MSHYKEFANDQRGKVMKYRILITKTLDVPKNLFNSLYTTEEEAMNAAQQKLLELDGDVAVVMELRAGSARIVQRFESIRKPG
jgi:hypothetical protein